MLFLFLSEYTQDIKTTKEEAIKVENQQPHLNEEVDTDELEDDDDDDEEDEDWDWDDAAGRLTKRHATVGGCNPQVQKTLMRP